MIRRTLLICIVVSGLLLVLINLAQAQESGPQSVEVPQAAVGTAFTYQGQLKSGGSGVTGSCEMTFRLFDAATLGLQIGAPITQTVAVNAGLFTTQLDFGMNAFDGQARWLEIAVKCASDAEFTTLARQELTATPYAVYSLSTGALQGRNVAGTAPTNGQVLKYNGSAWAPGGDNTASYQNVVIVAKSGGHYTTIGAALSSITNASALNHYLIRVMPGVYTETVAMKPHVDIEGAGELATTITYSGSTTWLAGTVTGANNAELRFLTVVNTGGNNYATAIYNNSASPHITHVTALASGGVSSNRGVSNYNSSSSTMTDVTASASGGDYSYGVYNRSSSPLMTDVTASASGGAYNSGVYNESSSPLMTEVTATASGGTVSHGMYNTASSLTIQNSILSASGDSSNYGIFSTAPSGFYTVTVNNSQITGSTATVNNNGTHCITRVGASLLHGGPVFDSGDRITCAGVYDEAYTFYASSCP